MAAKKYVRLRERNQITLPGDLTGKLGLRKDDYFEVQVTPAGRIQLTPARLARVGSPEAKQITSEAEEQIRNDEYETFSNADSFAAALADRAQSRRRTTPADRVEAAERDLIREALKKAGGNRRRAALTIADSLKRIDSFLKKYKQEVQ